ncbi:hypothetical protein [Paenibacillus koleovorans]|uniref:hypothetical protein n=1 Tax=Paenibacillus koleovorans TaxID=121608 RepID=UPI0013E3DE17|nr:hypothetical protein [Paenibacillus koleovorans]
MPFWIQYACDADYNRRFNFIYRRRYTLEDAIRSYSKSKEAKLGGNVDVRA